MGFNSAFKGLTEQTDGWLDQKTGRDVAVNSKIP